LTGTRIAHRFRLVQWSWVTSILVACFAVGEPGRSGETSHPPQPHKLRVVVFGAHCDDPESGAGGLIALLTRAGHEVICTYATCFRGGRTCFGRPEAEVRRQEAIATCKVLGATPKFFPYTHENLVADEATVKDVSAWLSEEQPDIVVTHWPMDTHPNHHVTSSLVWQCYTRPGGWNLYFFEVMPDLQTLGFQGDLYLDIESVLDIKKEARFCHESQRPERSWALHAQRPARRGPACGGRCAEAYSLVEAKPGCPLLPVHFLPKRD